MNITEYEKYDGCFAKITDRCSAGTYLELDNGQTAFAYAFSNLPRGAKVLCTVLRKAIDGRKTLVSIDSVVSYA